MPGRVGRRPTGAGALVAARTAEPPTVARDVPTLEVPTANRRRLDAELVRRGLASSRDQARALVDAGQVLVGGATAAKVHRLVDPGEPLRLTGPGPRFVGRGGEKLDAALGRFGLDVTGRRVLDAGASTGGFTDCLLQRDAASVWAVDVGHGQLHPRLRHDPRVVVRERCNVRQLRPEDTDGPFDLVVADLSFISLRTVAPALVRLTARARPLVLLVKPQFEVGRVEAARARGVIRDPSSWAAAVRGVAEAFAREGAGGQAVVRSPITGGDGNVELLLLAQVGSPPGSGLEASLAAALGPAGEA